jgi:hypothetical protein
LKVEAGYRLVFWNRAQLILQDFLTLKIWQILLGRGNATIPRRPSRSNHAAEAGILFVRVYLCVYEQIFN